MFFHGSSAAILALKDSAKVAAQGGDRPILISGPVGSGKSHLASFVHGCSGRADRPIVFLDCGALPEMENTLFGHRSGAFTGAVRDLGGRLRQADGGFLVLDDLERLSYRHQDQLHRVLVDGRFCPVGSDREARVDVRVVATINKDVEQEVSAGRLKADFISRISYFELAVPSLKERPEDIPELCAALLARNLAELVQKGLRQEIDIRFHEDCWPLIQAREFTDNVRGLDKLVVRLIARLGSRRLILPPDVEAVAPAPWTTSNLHWFDQPGPLRKMREAAERRFILEVCRHTNFNLRRAASILEISPKSLYAKLHQHGIYRP
jgi:DNA-binding NtrC family response regulator